MKLFSTILYVTAIAATVVVSSPAPAQDAPMSAEKAGEWVSLMDGKTFDGWKKTEENPDTWIIQNGAFVTSGSRSHLFYEGDHQPFKNFELKLDCKTTSGSNGGVYIHTAYQASGWPIEGYEIQVNQTHSDARKSGSIYAVNDVEETFVKDDEWYSYDIKVEGKRITVKMNDKVVNDWIEEPNRKPGTDFTRILTSGTIALQAHDPKSQVEYRNIKIKKLD